MRARPLALRPSNQAETSTTAAMPTLTTTTPAPLGTGSTVWALRLTHGRGWPREWEVRRRLLLGWAEEVGLVLGGEVEVGATSAAMRLSASAGTATSIIPLVRLRR